jgi:hypothetical protein
LKKAEELLLTLRQHPITLTNPQLHHMPIIEITPDSLQALKITTFADVGLKERNDLQRLLRAQIEVIAPKVLVIGEEFDDWSDSNKRIDLLGIDDLANLVVIELKRTDDGGHMELQALRYAAMVSQMTFDKAVEVFEHYLTSQGRRDNARETLLQFLNWDSPAEEQFAKEVRIVLASADFSRELTSTVLWLTNEHDLDIRCVRLRPYTDGKRVFLDVQQILPLPEASEYFVSIREKREEERQSRRQEREWSGLWFVNVGMHSASSTIRDQAGYGDIRHWENCKRFGYVAAGGGSRYSDALKRLSIGDPILVYQSGVGYVGYGTVSRLATPVHNFTLDDGSSLESTVNPRQPNLGIQPDLWEFAIGVQWHKSFDLSDAKTFKGAFANQNVVCKLSDTETVRFLRQEFGIPDAIRPSPVNA